MTEKIDLLVARRPWITDRAFEFLNGIVRPEWRSFEWGMGGSTLYLRDHCKLIISAEHDHLWCERVRSEDRKEDRVNRIVLVKPPHPTGPEGCIATSTRAPGCFESYVHAIHDVRAPWTSWGFDFISVDGRARVACMRHAKQYVLPGGWLMLDNSDRHDYRDGMRLFNDWQRHDFNGPGPNVAGPWCTTFWQRPGGTPGGTP